MDNCEWKDGELCEWKDGEFYACTRFGLDYRNCTYSKDNPKEVGVSIKWYESGIVSFCPFCGADIRKPKQPIIKKSGETWVGRSISGRNFICNEPEDYQLEIDYGGVDPNKGDFGSSEWWEITEIEITDEIAKLNPMIILCDEYGVLLGDIPVEAISVREEQVFYLKHPASEQEYYGSDWASIQKCRLATVDNLEDL